MTPTVGQITATIHQAKLRHPHLRCVIAKSGCPNGRYWVDHRQVLIYLDGRQDCNAAAAAILDGIAEIDAAHGITGDVVVPLQRSCRRAAHCR